MFAENLIFDIGMHKGEDADFYLKKGFRVIGVEANPALSDHCAKRFQDASQSGQLTIVNKAPQSPHKTESATVMLGIPINPHSPDEPLN